MAPNTGSIADFHPADTNYNPAIRRHRGRPAAYRRSPLSAQLNPEAIAPEPTSASETPAADPPNRPRLTILTSDLSTSPEPTGDEADTPHPSQDDSFSSADDVLDTYFESQPAVTTSTSGPVSPVDSTDDNDRTTADDPLSPVSPIAGPSTVGPHVRIANEPHPRQPLTPLQQQRETLRNMLRDFDKYILEPGEDEPQWMKFRGALQPAVQILATDQIIHALKHHLPSVQEALSQNAQLRAALARTQAHQDTDELELARLRAETRNLRGALNRLEVSPELRQDVMDLTLEHEQTKSELEKAQNELQESFEEREIQEGNLRLEIAAGEETLATLQREHDAVLADRQLLRTQAQQATQSAQRAQQQAREAYQETVSHRAQLLKAQAELETATDRIATLERQVTESCSVVLELRGEIYNLQQSRPHSSDPDAAESYPGPISPPSPRPPQSEHFAAPFPTASPDDPPTPSPPPSPLQQARRSLLADHQHIASILDPLEATAYSTGSLSKPAILAAATDSGLAGSQIVKAIRNHLPDIRDRQTIKAAYRRLQLRSADDQEVIAQLRSAVGNKERQIDGWRERVRVLERERREADDWEDEDDGGEVGKAVDKDAHALLVADLHETRALLTSLQHQNSLLHAADDLKTAQLHAAQKDVARLTEEMATLRSALDAAALAAMTNEQRQAGRITALGSQLADQRKENATLQTRLEDADTAANELRARLRACEARGEEYERVAGRLRAQLAASDEKRERESVKTEAKMLSLRMGLAIAESRVARQGGGTSGEGSGPAVDAQATSGIEVDMTARRWRNGNWDNEGSNWVDVLAFWGLVVGVWGVGWWVVGGGEVSALGLMALLALCGGLGGGVVWRFGLR